MEISGRQSNFGSIQDALRCHQSRRRIIFAWAAVLAQPLTLAIARSLVSGPENFQGGVDSLPNLLPARDTCVKELNSLPAQGSRSPKAVVAGPIVAAERLVNMLR